MPAEYLSHQMRLIITIILLFFETNLIAQQSSNTVFDFNTKLPVDNATVITNAGVAVTSSTGYFSVKYYANDTIRITHVGYKPYKFAVNVGLMPAVIYLMPDNIILNEVSIKGLRNYKIDSINNRRDFAKVFKYRSPGIESIFVTRSPYVKSDRPNNTSELVTINVLQLISLLGKQKTNTTKLQKEMIRDEGDSFVDRMFSKDKIIAITALKGDSLQSFMIRYRPSLADAKSMTSYDVLIYIKKSYIDFSKPDLK